MPDASGAAATVPSPISHIPGLFLNPSETWRAIAADPATVGGLYTTYIIPISAIPAVAEFLRRCVFGTTAFGGLVLPPTMPLNTGFVYALLKYLLQLVAIYLLAAIVDAVAPSQGGQRSRVQALKVVAYASTIWWLSSAAGLLGIGVGGLQMLLVFGGVAYGAVLFYLGLRIVMRAEQAARYTLITFVCAAILQQIVFTASAGLATPSSFSSATVNPFPLYPNDTASHTWGIPISPGNTKSH